MPIVRLVGETPKAAKPKKRPKFVHRYRNPSSVERRKLDEQRVFLRMGDEDIEILTPPAVARELGCSEPRVIQLIRENKVRASKLGRIWLVLASDLEEYIAAKQAEIRKRFPFIRGTGFARSPD